MFMLRGFVLTLLAQGPRHDERRDDETAAHQPIGHREYPSEFYCSAGRLVPIREPEDTMPDMLTIAAWIAVYAAGYLTPVGQNFLGDYLTDRRHKREAIADAAERFSDIQRAMPDLIRELREHFATHALAREFVVLRDKNLIYQDGPEKFRCYSDRQPTLTDNLAVLVDAGYISENRFPKSSSPLYRMKADFVELVKKSK